MAFVVEQKNSKKSARGELRVRGSQVAADVTRLRSVPAFVVSGNIVLEEFSQVSMLYRGDLDFEPSRLTWTSSEG